jgi:hypothetical protein
MRGKSLTPVEGQLEQVRQLPSFPDMNEADNPQCMRSLDPCVFSAKQRAAFGAFK